MSVTDDTLLLAAALKRDLQKITDQHTRDLVAAWARAWDEIRGDLDRALRDLADQAGEGRITRAAVRRSTRLREALNIATSELERLAQDAGIRIVGDLQAIVTAAGQAQHGLVASQLPPQGQHLAVSWDRADRHALRAIVERSTEQVTSLTKPLSDDATAAMKRELIRGIAGGTNPRDTAVRMLARSEGAFNGGLTRALTISRTETLDAYRAGARLAQLLNNDVLAGWIWLADLDKRTCPACVSMNGSEHDLDEQGPDGHQNCRCTRLPLTKTWRELGFDLPEPASTLPDSRDWFDGLDQGEQVHLLGRGRFDAWTRGDLPISDWAVRRQNTGWRDSYVPVKVPA